MKIFFRLFLFSSLLVLACSEEKVKSSPTKNAEVLKLPETVVLKSEVIYDHKLSLWTLNDSPYSGFVVSYYGDSNLREKFGILNGKKQNKAIQWFPDGHFKNVANYHEGKLQGEKKVWTSDSKHVLIAQYHYDKGKPHGKQKKWYPTGELYKIISLSRGKEEGLQQAFRKNGVLYANYEARNGRIFGLKKGNLCYQLEDEIVIRN